MSLNENSDTAAGIKVVAQANHTHIVAGIHVGRMGSSISYQIGSILTLAAVPGIVPDHIKHKHIPLSYQLMDQEQLELAAAWALDQIQSDRLLLIRSEKGRQRPPLIAAMTIILLGGRYDDAMSCIRQAAFTSHTSLLTDFRYLALLKEFDKKHGLGRR